MTEVLRMRATLEDGASPSLARIRQNMRAAGQGVDTSKTRREFQQLVQPIKNVADNVTGGMLPAFDKMKFSLSTSVLAIAAVGYATVKAAQQFRDFSRSVADLKFAAAGMDVSTQNLVAFQKAAKQFRIDPEQSSAALQAFTKNADDFRKKIGSLREELYNYRAGDLVEGIRQTTDNIDALRLAMERIQKLNERDPATARRLSEMLFGTPDIARMKFEDVAKAMEKVRAAGIFTPEQVKASEEFRQQWEKLASTIDDVKNRLMFGMFPAFTAGLKAANTALDVTIKGVEKLRDLLTTPGEPLKLPEGSQRPGGESAPGSGWGRLPHMRKPASFETEEEMRRFNDLLKKVNFQLERTGSLSPFGPGNGGVINAALTSGGGSRGGGGWGSSQFPALGGGGGGGGGFGGGGGGLGGGGRRSGGGIPSNSDLDAADRKWWGGDNQGDVGRAGGAGGTVGGEFMEGRKRAAAELEAKPWLKEKLFGIVMGENKDYNAGLSVMESAMNRAAVRGTSLEKQLRLHAQSGINEGGYYAGYRPRDVARYRERLEGQLKKALEGSNVSDYATDNASIWLAQKHRRTGRFVMRSEYGGRGGTGSPGMETFFRPGLAEKGHARRWEQMYADAISAGQSARGGASANIDRSMIDQALAPPSVNATGSVSVNVVAPSGTKVGAKSEGMFQETKITRQRQMGGPDEP